MSTNPALSNREHQRAWYYRNQEKKAELCKRWQAANFVRFRACQVAYKLKRKKTDPQYAMELRLRARTKTYLNDINASQDTFRPFIGCTIRQLRAHLESKFTEGMNWENRSAWHVDHIRPMFSFNLLNESEQFAACHYTNLQPLWARDNLRKRKTDLETYKKLALSPILRLSLRETGSVCKLALRSY